MKNQRENKSKRGNSVTTHSGNWVIEKQHQMYQRPGPSCDVKISSDQTKNGSITSPGFPGQYPPKTTCQYEFIASGRERIQLVFTDFSLFAPNELPKDLWCLKYTESSKGNVYDTAILSPHSDPIIATRTLQTHITTYRTGFSNGESKPTLRNQSL
uniref:CUB domain-containing protein n=1 Tax=Rhodnius prolixus TaxID=13249 RepID=T1HQZ8_RHOPR